MIYIKDYFSRNTRFDGRPLAGLLRFFGRFDVRAGLAPSPDVRFAPSGSASPKQRADKTARLLPGHLRIPPFGRANPKNLRLTRQLMALAQVSFTAAYMAKYIAKDILTAPFRKGERRYSISKGIRSAWPNSKEPRMGYDTILHINRMASIFYRHYTKTSWQRQNAGSNGTRPATLKSTRVKNRHRVIYKKYKPKHSKKEH